MIRFTSAPGLNLSMSAIAELSELAGVYRIAMSVEAGLDPCSNVDVAAASGLDLALTLFEQGTGARFHGLSPEVAGKVVEYFHSEATRSDAIDGHIAIFYRAWAAAIAHLYLDERPAGITITYRSES